MDHPPRPVPAPANVRRPRLTITAGPPLSGKSDWAASAKSTRPGFSRDYISRDYLRTELAGPDYLSSPLRSEIEDAVSQRMRYLAREGLLDGHDIVIDGGNTHPLSRRNWKRLAHECSAAFRVVIFDPTYAQIAQRNLQRTPPLSDADLRAAHQRWRERRVTFSDRDPDNEFI